jgi:hypothetical protein
MAVPADSGAGRREIGIEQDFERSFSQRLKPLILLILFRHG